MKLVTFLVILLFAYCICHSTNEVSEHSGLFEYIKEKTSNAIDYVTSKGRSLKNIFVDNVGNNITSIYHNDLNNETGKEKKLNAFLNGNKAQSNNLNKEVAPDVITKCSDSAPSNTMTTTQLTASHGYVSESHTILTEDGYLLTIHRIPYNKTSVDNISPKKTVLLHHGLLGSSADWVIPGPEKGLAYILSNAGYDVWMANARGNTYSRAHISRTVDSFTFWNFTFHDVSQHDLPAVINYIVNKKGQNAELNYIGFSMGTTVLFALLSTKPEYNNILKAGFLMAPVAYMSNVKSPFKYASKPGSIVHRMMKMFGADEFLGRHAVLRYLTKNTCKLRNFEEALCKISMYTLCGHDENQFNQTLIPMIFGHIPAGTSTKTLAHYGQEIKNDGRFQQFDYGLEDNLKQYGTALPPEYPVHKITLPLALFSGQDDWLSSVSDGKRLYDQLKNPIEHYVIPMNRFNHLNFLFGIDAPTLVYDKLIHLMNTFESNI